jgi:hydrogenase expression/formation protein HypC
MCLAVPGKVVEIYREHDVRMGKVDFAGVRKRVCLEHVPEAELNDYVLVHVGFALSRIDQTEAARVFEFLRSMDQLDELNPLPDLNDDNDLSPRSPPQSTPRSHSNTPGGRDS